MKFKRSAAVLTAVALIAAALLSFSACGRDEKKNTGGKYTVGICQLAPHDALDAATKGFKEQLQKELGDKVEFLENNAQGEAANCTTIINNYVTRKVDLIMANATAALQAAANGTEDIPILGTSVTDYGTALGLDDFDGLAGGNISGTSDLAPLDEQAAMLKSIFPDAGTAGLLYCSSEANSAYQIKVIKRELEKYGIACKDFAFTDSNDVSAVAAAAAECDVIYIPTDNTAASCAATILGAVKDTPIIAGEENLCAVCGVATLTINYYDLGAATGKMAARILGGADISEMKIEYSDKFAKKYNAARCAELGIDVSALEAEGYTAIGR